MPVHHRTRQKPQRADAPYPFPKQSLTWRDGNPVTSGHLILSCPESARLRGQQVLPLPGLVQPYHRCSPPVPLAPASCTYWIRPLNRRIVVRWFEHFPILNMMAGSGFPLSVAPNFALSTNQPAEPGSLYRRQEHEPRTEEACFDCRNGRFERLRCFSCAKFPEIAKYQDISMFCRQFRHGPANRPGCFNAGKRLVRRFIARSDGLEILKRLTEWPTLFLPE